MPFGTRLIAKSLGFIKKQKREKEKLYIKTPPHIRHICFFADTHKPTLKKTKEPNFCQRTN